MIPAGSEISQSPLFPTGLEPGRGQRSATLLKKNEARELANLGGLPQATAQPSITKQPTSIAVALGGAATLQVTASAPTPLTYQWQRGKASTVNKCFQLCSGPLGFHRTMGTGIASNM